MNRKTEFASAVSGFSDKGKAILEKIPAPGGGSVRRAGSGNAPRKRLEPRGVDDPAPAPGPDFCGCACFQDSASGPWFWPEGRARAITAFFWGANLEFPAQALNQSIHAEQAALVNARHQGARKITAPGRDPAALRPLPPVPGRVRPRGPGRSG